MMRPLTYAFLAGLLAVSACKAPATKYRLSADQLDWQLYQEGRVLRFGNSRTPAVRTYRVSQVADGLVEYGGFCVCIGAERPQFQQRTVTLIRTDTATVYNYDKFNVLSLSTGGSINSMAPSFLAATDWESDEWAKLPIDEVNAGLPFDTTTTYSIYYKVKLFSNYQLGATTYDKVIRVPLGYKSTTAVYHAKKSGVVAFEDKRTGLWYRLP